MSLTTETKRERQKSQRNGEMPPPLIKGKIKMFD